MVKLRHEEPAALLESMQAHKGKCHHCDGVVKMERGADGSLLPERCRCFICGQQYYMQIDDLVSWEDEQWRQKFTADGYTGPKCYIENPDGTLRRAESMDEWLLLFNNRWEHKSILKGDVLVSTVFIGIDHNFSDKGPPLLYETMVFGRETPEDCWRYATREEALEGHERVVASLTN